VPASRSREGDVLRPKPSRLVSAVLLLSALVALGCSEAAEAGAREAITLDFDATAVGELPEGFSTALTGGGGPAAWRVVEDATAPSGGKVLAQTSTDRTSARFPLCLYEGLTAADVEVSVRFKPVSGTVDQAAGLVARYRDKDHYYIVRANALEHNVRLYKVERGKRTQFAGVAVKVPANAWQTLTLEVKGTHFRVFLNDNLLFEADDRTFRDAGKVGLWTKADSVTYFDDLAVKTSATR
jgi:Beta xylosidase C-terminal Concanavalin A-like domain